MKYFITDKKLHGNQHDLYAVAAVQWTPTISFNLAVLVTDDGISYFAGSGNKEDEELPPKISGSYTY